MKQPKSPIRKGTARTPVILQMEAVECGAASLAMIMAYYGKWVPLEQVRADCGVSRDGSNARNVAMAAKRYGFEVEAFRRTPEEMRRNGRYPCIIHWNFCHFVVLNGFQGRYACLNDPARGAVRVTMEEFDKSFTGITMEIAPGEHFVPENRRKTNRQYLKRLLYGTGGSLACLVLTAGLSCLFGVLEPVTTKVLVDRLLTGQDPEWLMPYTLLVAVLALMQIAVSWVSTLYTLKLRGRLAILGSTSFMWKLLQLPMEFFSQRMTGDVQSRLRSGTFISGAIVSTMLPLMLQTAMMLVYLILMLRQSLLLTAIGVTALTLDILLSGISSARQRNAQRIRQRDEARLASAAASGVQMIETIKASGAEESFFRKWAGYQASVNAQTAASEPDSVLGGLPALLTALAQDAVLVIGVWYVMQGHFTLGTLAMFQGFLGAFLRPAAAFPRAARVFGQLRTRTERTTDVLQYPSDPAFTAAPETSQPIHKLSGKIELRHVTFGYSRLAPPLIRDFSMTVEPGSRIAFVGASGSGKSTISKLISGLYQPWRGEILFDGKSRAELPRAVMTGSLAVVDQDITLFEGTIEENIKMWDNSIQDFEMILAARDAQLHEDIMHREGGYRSRLRAGGRELSGGQRQLLEIARVLAQDPSVIILDEATSALDARTEADVVQAIRDRGVTCIVIAHRLSTIRDCDEIIVLDHGKVAERGTHAELMQNGGIYTELVVNA